jgi:hypothetical protein
MGAIVIGGIARSVAGVQQSFIVLVVMFVATVLVQTIKPNSYSP